MRSTKENNNKLSKRFGFLKRRRFLLRPISRERGLRANGLSLLPLALRPGLGCLILALVLGIMASFYASFSDSASATSISLSIPGALSLDINSASPSGTFVKSEKSVVTAQTDSATGYTLSIKSKDSADGNCLKNGDKKLESISSAVTEEEYESSGAMNSWGYLPDKFNSLENSKFLPAPTSSESVINKTKLGNIAPDSYGITLAAKVNTDVPAGAYKNNYILTAVANALSYKVTYDLNSGSGGPAKNPDSGTTEGSSFKVDSTAPTREGYEFKGWCTSKPAEDGSCSGAVVQPGGDFPIYCDSNDVTLWAMWREPNYKVMQGFSCNLVEEQTITAIDARDENLYTIAKLKDGKCWMTQNLSISGKTLSPVDSDVKTNFTLPTDSKGIINYELSRVYIDGNYGGYYTWFAATVGEGTQDKNSGNTTQSICPRGWRLPTSSDYVGLASAYGGNNSTGSAGLRAAPANFVYSGFYGDNGSPVSQNGNGLYWSSTAYSSDKSKTHDFYIINDQADGNYLALKNSALAVRCVVR